MSDTTKSAQTFRTRYMLSLERSSIVRTFSIISAAGLALMVSVATAQIYTAPPAVLSPTPVIQGIPLGATIPRVLTSIPQNGDQAVPSNLEAVFITFSEPMDTASFYYPIPNAADFPMVTAEPFWTTDNLTFVIPCNVYPITTYHIPINIGNQILFRSLKGVSANPGLISFMTGGSIRIESVHRPAGVTPFGFNVTAETPRIPRYVDPVSVSSLPTPLPAGSTPIGVPLRYQNQVQINSYNAPKNATTGMTGLAAGNGGGSRIAQITPRATNAVVAPVATVVRIQPTPVRTPVPTPTPTPSPTPNKIQRGMGQGRLAR